MEVTQENPQTKVHTLWRT